MRASAAIALIAYSGFLVGVACVGISVDGCATAPDDSDAGYVSTTPTGTTRTPTPDATSPSQGDDEASSPPPTEDAPTTTPPGDDAGEDADASDDGGDEAATPPCASNQTCVDQAPMGWTGYVQLRIATADAGVGACGAPYGAVQQAGVADPTGAPAQCSPCTCGAPAPAVVCTSGYATGNYGCSPGTTTYTPLTAGDCVSTAGLNGANGATETPTANAGSSCAPDGGTLVGALDAATSTPAIVCALGTGDGGAVSAPDAAAALGPICDSTQACAAAISSQAGPSGVCIYQSGVETCPMGTVFTEQHLVGASVADTRGCGCSCGAPQCPGDGVVEAFTNSGCTGTPSKTFDAGSACVVGYYNFSNPYFKYVQSKSSAAGNCDVDDAGPSGGVGVDSTTAMTLCCIP